MNNTDSVISKNTVDSYSPEGGTSPTATNFSAAAQKDAFLGGSSKDTATKPAIREISSPSPSWETERQRVEAVLTNTYQVQPKTSQLRDISLIAEGVYNRTRIQAQPFLTPLFEEGAQRYFDRLSGAAYSINTSMTPKKGELPEKTYEQLLEEHSIRVLGEVADMWGQRERLKTGGLTETEEGAAARWEQIAASNPDFLKPVADLDNTVKETREAGAVESSWLIGLKAIQAKLHTRMDLIDRNAASHTEASSPKADGTFIKNESNKLAMEITDDIELALPNINRNEWKQRFQSSQAAMVDFLDTQGIRRLVPKSGEPFDPKWQHAIDSKGSGNTVNGFTRSAFVDKSSGKLIQDANVIVA